jgi:hypothetical protein
VIWSARHRPPRRVQARSAHFRGRLHLLPVPGAPSGRMVHMTSPDPRAVTEFRIPAADLKPGDLVNLSPGEDDWQQVVGVYLSADDVKGDNTELRELMTSLEMRYVVVELTDLAPVDEPIYFAEGVALIVGEDGDDQPVSAVVSTEFGVRTFIYTKFELVASRSK